MKRFLLISVLCLLTSAALASDWGTFEPFKVTVNGYEVSYAFCECDIAMLDEPIPQAALDYPWSDRRPFPARIPHPPLPRPASASGSPG